MRGLKPNPRLTGAARRFRRKAETLATYDDVFDLLEEEVAGLGLAGFSYWTFPRTALAAAGTSGAISPRDYVLTSRGPLFLKAFEVLAARVGWRAGDPLLVESSRRTESFTTAEILRSRTFRGLDRAMIVLMERFGLHHDLYVPLHSPQRIQILYTFLLGHDQALARHISEVRAEFEALAREFAIAIPDFLPVAGRDDQNAVLSIREQECLGLMARGLSYEEIAAELGISKRTVKFHVTNLLRKLGAKSRSEAIAIAARSNWLVN